MDVLGQTIGEAIAGGISKQMEKSRAEREWEERVKQWEGTVYDSDFALLPMDEAMALSGAKYVEVQYAGNDAAAQRFLERFSEIEARSAPLEPLDPERMREAYNDLDLQELGSTPPEGRASAGEIEWETPSLLERIERGEFYSLLSGQEPVAEVRAASIILEPSSEAILPEVVEFYATDHFDVYYIKSGGGAEARLGETIEPNVHWGRQSNRGDGYRPTDRPQIARDRFTPRLTGRQVGIDPAVIIHTSEVLFKHSVTPYDLPEFETPYNVDPPGPTGPTHHAENMNLYATRAGEVIHVRVPVPFPGMVRAHGVLAPYAPGMLIRIVPDG